MADGNFRTRIATLQTHNLLPTLSFTSPLFYNQIRTFPSLLPTSHLSYHPVLQSGTAHSLLPISHRIFRFTSRRVPLVLQKSRWWAWKRVQKICGVLKKTVFSLSAPLQVSAHYWMNPKINPTLRNTPSSQPHPSSLPIFSCVPRRQNSNFDMLSEPNHSFKKPKVPTSAPSLSPSLPLSLSPSLPLSHSLTGVKKTSAATRPSVSDLTKNLK